jgi:ADP-ribose pyrophosphatase YjhB (NUDIX family)
MSASARGRAPGAAPPAAAPAPDLAGAFAAIARDHVPHLSVDGVVFGAHAGSLRVLLVRWFGLDAWGLPGGYVRHDEDVDAAAARMVREVTGLEGVYLRQFHTFGQARRAEAAAAVFQAAGRALPVGHWALGRVVSVGYVALVDAGRARVVPHALATEHRWSDVAERPPLFLDHDAMVDRALASLRARLDELPLGATLLPGAFTMPELQRLYETVLGRPLDRRNFQNRVLGLGLVERLPGQRVSRTSRPLNLYRWTGREAADVAP